MVHADRCLTPPPELQPQFFDVFDWAAHGAGARPIATAPTAITPEPTWRDVTPGHACDPAMELASQPFA